MDALTPKMQKDTLDSFRSGKVIKICQHLEKLKHSSHFISLFSLSKLQVNLLFTTDVAEEGIHVPECSCVIRFDLPRTTRSYVQSRGRARQEDSQYILMIERYNLNATPFTPFIHVLLTECREEWQTRRMQGYIIHFF